MDYNERDFKPKVKCCSCGDSYFIEKLTRLPNGKYYCRACLFNWEEYIKNIQQKTKTTEKTTNRTRI